MRLAKLLDFLGRVVGPVQPVAGRLHICPRCHKDFVVPVCWEKLGETHWIRLRCGQCGFIRQLEVENEAAERLKLELARGQAEIAAALARLDRQRMIADWATFAAALEHDLVGPGDFSG
jgi:hypothetical protein